MSNSGSSHPGSSLSTNHPPPIIAWAPVFDNAGFVTTGEHLKCPYRCKIEFEFIGALISHLERRHTLDSHREVEASETSAKTRKYPCRWLGCDHIITTYSKQRCIAHIKIHLDASLLGTLPFGSRVSQSPPQSSLSPTPEERSNSYTSLFGRTHSPSPAPSSERSSYKEGSSNRHLGTIRLRNSQPGATETLDDEDPKNSDEEGSNVAGGRGDDVPEPAYVARNRNREDDEEEDEDEESIKSEPGDDRMPSSAGSSRATTPPLNLTPLVNPSPTPVSTPTPTPGPALVPDYDNAAAPPEQVEYIHEIDHPTGIFEHRVTLNHDEPIPKFKYLLQQKDARRSCMKVVPMKRKREDNGEGGDENEN